MLRRSVLGAALTALVGCGGSSSQSGSTAALPSYLLGEVTGTYADGVAEVFDPRPWDLERADRPLIVDRQTFLDLSPADLEAVRELVALGQPLIILGAAQPEVDRASALVGRAPILDLGGRYVDIFALSSSRGTYAFEVPWGSTDRIATEDQIRLLDYLVEWSTEPREQQGGIAEAAVAGLDPVELDLLTDVTAYSNSQLYPLTLAYTTHGALDSVWRNCVNNYIVELDAWPIFLATSGDGSQVNTDYFVIQASGQFDASACYGWYQASGDAHGNRISAYYHDKIFFSSSVAELTNQFDDFMIVPGQNTPFTTQPTESNQTGLMWNLGGTGTVSSSQGASVGFSAGVTFVNLNTVTYPAVQVSNSTTSSAGNGSGGPGGTGTAQWGYDFSPPNYPGDHCCGTSIGTTPTSSASGFETTMTWIWQATSAVRDQYGTGGLPVSLYLSPSVGYRWLGEGPYTAYAQGSPGVETVTGIEPRPDCSCYTEEGTLPVVYDNCTFDPIPVCTKGPRPAFTPTTWNLPFAAEPGTTPTASPSPTVTPTVTVAPPTRTRTRTITPAGP